MFSFEIGQRESGFYSERTDRQNHRQTKSCQHPVPYYNIDILLWFTTHKLKYEIRVSVYYKSLNKQKI